ncbi:VWA domain-containing protein [Imperialibacter roseus]|uniref:VWA domain-containing protein n=1 Tax=Imperialibacter roseus TaxID=1324217 RepID=A0ABZ0IKG3_9BACT|nr:VWA domain-containing protein [Imperialibacter roseus]WOK04480.1 VWA domain-containing protein [Imperialibacter roseus]
MKNLLRKATVIAGLLSLFSFPVFAQVYKQKPPEKTRILFLLDASGSMLAKLGNVRRIDVATKLLSDLVDSLSVNPNVELALRVYGHQYARAYNNCTDTKLEVGFSAKNHRDIRAKLYQLTPQGNTPIAYSLEQTANDFPKVDGYRNVVIIITDGIESCEGDPCAVSKALQSKNIFLKPFVIGLGLGLEYEKNFECLGKYFDATDVPRFKKSLNEVLRQTLMETTASVELLNENNAPIVTDVNVSFINTVTRQSVYDFVHYRDKLGRPDSVILDAVLTYDVVANTVPPVVKKNVALIGGIHNIIDIRTPQGNLAFQMPGASEYSNPVQASVRLPGQTQSLNIQKLTEPFLYLAGTYDIEVQTFPRTFIRGYTIKPSQDNSITLPGPGVLNLTMGVRGIGSLYKINPDGSQEWVCNFPGNITSFVSAIQPGEYKFVFRAQSANGSKFTEIKKFSIRTGSTETIKLYGR